MAKVAIVVDGVNDLSKKIIEEYNIHTIPMRMFLGEDEHKIWHNDKCSISLEDFVKYQLQSSKDQLPRTAMPSLNDFSTVFNEVLKDHESIIAILMSSGLSGTTQVAQSLINNNFKDKDITIFDSLQTMTGTGIHALEAAKMAKEGKSKEEILKHLEDINTRVRTLFVMEDLNYLYKGGRIGRAKKIMGSAFGVIPTVQMKDGVITPFTTFKGKKNLTEQLKNFCVKLLEKNETGDIFLNHINQHDVTQEIYDAMKTANGNGTQIHYNESGPILGVYSGPKTICITYIGDIDEKWLIS